MITSPNYLTVANIVCFLRNHVLETWAAEIQKRVFAALIARRSQGLWGMAIKTYSTRNFWFYGAVSCLYALAPPLNFCHVKYGFLI